jgi:ATP-dependent DNA helicase RecG
MESIELLELINRGEDSSHQFKKNITHADSLAADMVAFSNGIGGIIIIGVNDDGSIAGLSSEDIRRLNQLISNTASQHIQPPINPITENMQTSNGLIMFVDIPSGINRPYQDKNGAFWVKSGADKRRATSREEVQRLFQKSSLIHADEIPVSGATTADLDLDYFKEYCQKRFGKIFEKQNLPLNKILENMKLVKDGLLTVGGTLLFAKAPQFLLPAFVVKAVAVDANIIDTENYKDSRNIEGKMADVFQQTVSFILSNLHHIQKEQSFNSIGIPEIPQESIIELVANTLMHRDYFVSAPVRVFIFRDRVEIISPGHLPNNLTVENIKAGNSNARNPALASHASHILPYRGIGSGIIRALEKYPDIDFYDDREGNLFKVTIKRLQT